MSLFKAREWWSTTVGEEEEFDLGCLCVANIDNHANGQDKIIVGSFHGTLRVYHPRPSKTENGWSGFKPEDQMLETNLNFPILQIEAGRFVSVNEKLHLAVLHSRKLVIYSVSMVTGAVEHGCHYQLNQIYEHVLKRTAFSMCIGPFGGVKGKDFLCVQSMDGTISVFEQESFSFCRFLPGALLPGPIKYVQKTDSFVTVSSGRQVESYRYQVLATATDAKTKEESQSIKSGKRVAIDWAFNIGEQAVDLCVVAFSQNTAIYVLGERNVYCLTEFGKLKHMKKFEYNPSCFLPYGSVIEGTTNYMVATHTSSLMIYQDVTLKWAAQLQHIPVQVKLGNFQDLKGVIVMLSDQGHIDCCYLGTDPAMMVPPSSESREINYAEQDEEMKRLQKIIKQKSSKAAVLPTSSADSDIQVITSVPRDLDAVSLSPRAPMPVDPAFGYPILLQDAEPASMLVNDYMNMAGQASDVDVHDEDTIPSITVKIQVKSRTLVNNVRLTINVPSPLTANQKLFTFPVVDSNRPVEVFVSFYLQTAALPAQLTADVVALYTSSSGAPRVTEAKVVLPLRLVMKPCMPVKSATHKLTIDTNKSPVNLNDLFPELLGENAGGPGNALGFQYFGGPVVTLLASKSSQRYRLQCDRFEAMWLLTSDLICRLEKHYSKQDFKASFAGPLPLNEYYEVIENHFQFRLHNDKYKELLAQRATQFRAIQRRLLTRFKDKTPAPLANLDTLLDGTFRQLLALADASEENKRAQERAASDLGCCTRLLCLLVKLWANISDQEVSVLESTLSPCVTEGSEQGWEEMVGMSITHLLRTTLSKNAKDQQVNPAPLAMAKDTVKLKKHIALLFERLGKGAKLVTPDSNDTPSAAGATTAAAASKKPIQRYDSQAEFSSTSLGEAEVPTGSKFGEKKSPRQANNNNLPPLGGGATKLAPLAGGSSLPPLSGGVNDVLKKKRNIESSIPDLDELTTNGDSYHPLLANGHGKDDVMEV